MSKNTRAEKEFSREQRLVNENKKLKKELAHLRKQMSRIDMDRLETIREMCADQEETERFREKTEDATPTVDALRKEWACKECDSGYLEIFKFSKMDCLWYYRKCNSCPKRTRSQKYTSKVKGIIYGG